MSPVVMGKLEAMRRRLRVVAGASALGHGAAWVVGGIVVAAGVEAWAGAVPYGARALIAGVVVVAGGAMAWVRGGREAVAGRSDVGIALEIERAVPGLRQRLVTLAERPALAGGVEAQLNGEAERMVGGFEARAAKPMARAAWLLPLAVAVMGAGVGVPGMRAYVLRALAIPGVGLPRQTRVEVLGAEPMLVPLGGDVVLEARAVGRAPREGGVLLGGARRPVAASADGHFRLKLTDIRESFSYRIALNDDVSEERHVRALAFPAVLKMEVVETPPGYTRLGARGHALDDLTFVEGALVRVSIRANKRLAAKGSALSLAMSEGAAVVVPLVVEGEAASATFVPPVKMTSMAVSLADTDGLSTPAPVARHVEVIPDRPPTLSVLLPVRTDDLVTSRATVRVGFETADDYGLGAIRLHVSVRAGAAVVERPIDLDVTAGTKSVRATFPWAIGKLGLPEGSEVEWWVEAVDENNVSGPGRTASEHRHLRIASEAEVRKALLARLDKSVEELQGTRESQQDLARQLDTLMREKAVSP